MSMKKRIAQTLVAASLACCLTGSLTAAAEETWPSGDVTLIVPAAAGGGTDIMARIVATYLQETTGENFLVVNQDSGSGMVAYETVRNADPDGSTLLFWHTGFYVNYYSGMYEHNPSEAFTPISMLNNKNTSQVFVVNGDSEWNNLDDLAAAAQAEPDTITYGCQMGGSAQMVGEILMKATGTQLRLVDAASQTDKITGVMGGVIDVSAITTSAAAQYVESGDLKVIGIVDGYADPDYPDFVPAVDQGYEDLHWTQNLCVFGPAGMDEELAKTIAAAMEGLADNEKAAAQMAEAKMPMFALNYEDSQQSFTETDALVASACEGVDWGN